MKRLFRLDNLLFLLLLTVSANAFLWVKNDLRALFLLIPAMLAIHIFPGMFGKKIMHGRLRVCYHGAVLLAIFLLSVFFPLYIISSLQKDCLPRRLFFGVRFFAF